MKKVYDSIDRDPFVLSTRLAEVFPVKAYPGGDDKIYVRYATGFSEYISVSDVARLLDSVQSSRRKG